jgi:hypothetical protein
MTRFSDNLYSGQQAITSALSSKSPVVLCKTHRIAGGTSGSTVTGTFPIGTQNLDAKLYILLNASATVSDKITVSAGGVDLITLTQFGSASGVLRSTTTGLGVLTTTASACAVVAGAAAAELPYAVTLSSEYRSYRR